MLHIVFSPYDSLLCGVLSFILTSLHIWTQISLLIGLNIKIGWRVFVNGRFQVLPQFLDLSFIFGWAIPTHDFALIKTVLLQLSMFRPVQTHKSCSKVNFKE